LNASDASGICGLTNLVGVPVNENTDGTSISWQRLDDLPRNFGFRVAWALHPKVQPNKICAELDTRSCVVRVRNTANFNLDRSHDCRTAAMRSRNEFSGLLECISASPMRKPRNPSA